MMSYRGAWSAETSADPSGWTPENPSWGQCAVTALVLQDLFGGTLVRSTVGGVSHYWNQLPDGSFLDLTLRQFGWGAEYDVPPIARERSYLLSNADTARRYNLLRERMGQE
jgi:hypothetical protein